MSGTGSREETKSWQKSCQNPGKNTGKNLGKMSKQNEILKMLMPSLQFLKNLAKNVKNKLERIMPLISRFLCNKTIFRLCQLCVKKMYISKTKLNFDHISKVKN